SECEPSAGPPAWYAFTVGEGKPRRTALAQKSPADFSDCEVVREFATSADGTKVPLSIVKRKNAKLDGNNPTLLTGYGGFGISVKPRFRAAGRALLGPGGGLARAHPRGGGGDGEGGDPGGRAGKEEDDLGDLPARAP